MCLLCLSTSVVVNVILSVFYQSVFFFLMIRRPPRSTQSRSSAASDVYKRQNIHRKNNQKIQTMIKLDFKGPFKYNDFLKTESDNCLLYTSPSPRDRTRSRMPSSA